ncbi:hypothetical protein AVEN_271761-1 [Araneus ventricosus]|uniref:Uncharacterized protein n=1 Tax=Araneus ventricosus TaxID=182803 RepID=A0A4Y2U4G1_ARAVE|nr:hypothetical protein AVEN_65548-1 [Araneus ventricosus]GBO06884.1 hypothetical protein AVEN_271761-1 [Araneus ventricosus]
MTNSSSKGAKRITQVMLSQHPLAKSYKMKFFSNVSLTYARQGRGGRVFVLWATRRSRVPVDGAAIASDVRESSGREKSRRRRGGLNDIGLVSQDQNTK